MNKLTFPLLALLFTMLFASCNSYSTPPMQRDYVDAVTNINQVDPYYRQFFRSQNGSNYTLADQRKAYVAAIQTARTPVRASEYRPKADTRVAKRTTRKSYNKRRAVASRGKASRGKSKAKRRATASRSKASKGKSKAKRRATASRRTSRSRRKG